MITMDGDARTYSANVPCPRRVFGIAVRIECKTDDLASTVNNGWLEIRFFGTGYLIVPLVAVPQHNRNTPIYLPPGSTFYTDGQRWYDTTILQDDGTRKPLELPERVDIVFLFKDEWKIRHPVLAGVEFLGGTA